VATDQFGRRQYGVFTTETFVNVVRQKKRNKKIGGIKFIDNDFRYKRGGSRAAEGRQCNKYSLNMVEDDERF
jgi:hypothetical protein